VTQPWLRRGTAPDPSLRCSHGWKEVNDAPARLTTDPSCKDEARVGQQGTLTRVWARRGSRPRAPRDRRHAWAYLFGAVCPERAVGAGLVLPYADTEAMGLHLAEIGRHVGPGAHAVAVLDRAGWHGAGDLAVPENLTLLPLPRYSPELNPVENVWECLRRNQLSLRVWPDYEATVETCCTAWNALMREPDRIASITRRDWAKAVNN
jgi:putative transposase